ncbi:MAG: hypothetical protein EOM23_04985 [Candidatus Moranbacteria bacterium]|nr:hypothetical protein [Candidatus Moranbacteria bacterium]
MERRNISIIFCLMMFVFIYKDVFASADVNPWIDKINMVDLGMTKKEVEKILPFGSISACGGYGTTIKGGDEYVTTYHLDSNWRVSNTYKWSVPWKEREHVKGKNYQTPEDKIVKKPELEYWPCGVVSEGGKGMWKGEHVINFTVIADKEMYSEGDEILLTGRVENVSQHEIMICPDSYNTNTARDLVIMDSSKKEVFKESPNR